MSKPILHITREYSHGVTQLTFRSTEGGEPLDKDRIERIVNQEMGRRALRSSEGEGPPDRPGMNAILDSMRHHPVLPVAGTKAACFQDDVPYTVRITRNERVSDVIAALSEVFDIAEYDRLQKDILLSSRRSL